MSHWSANHSSNSFGFLSSIFCVTNNHAAQTVIAAFLWHNICEKIHIMSNKGVGFLLLSRSIFSAWGSASA